MMPNMYHKLIIIIYIYNGMDCIPSVKPCPPGYYEEGCSKPCPEKTYGVSCGGTCDCSPEECNHEVGCTNSEASTLQTVYINEVSTSQSTDVNETAQTMRRNFDGVMSQYQLIEVCGRVPIHLQQQKYTVALVIVVTQHKMKLRREYNGVSRRRGTCRSGIPLSKRPTTVDTCSLGKLFYGNPMQRNYTSHLYLLCFHR
ncbi:uncharacterized protein LOC125649576 isoform X2 [Ostrea edulis]|uniref:uncharacterized protein LOC125649576 isoform X2 n=1 Tax=Ostrea edulis TaxID=37623 RepID=UPI0024AF0DFB|nr:uncharacterized protein LOC125649576 isoform X2 [Ostrea edulis]